MRDLEENRVSDELSLVSVVVEVTDTLGSLDKLRSLLSSSLLKDSDRDRGRFVLLPSPPPFRASSLAFC